MKRCTKCGIEKELAEFAKDKGQKSGLKCACRACFRAYKVAVAASGKKPVAEKACCRCKIVKPAADFYKSAHQNSGLFSACKTCEQARILREKTQRSAYWRKRYQEKMQEYHLVKKYGVTLQRRSEMLASQNGKCPICQRLETDLPRILAVDHCHATSTIRGLLCQLCNTGLGAFEDDTARMLRAVSYVTSGGVGGAI